MGVLDFLKIDEEDEQPLKLFISHSSKDKRIVEAFIDLLEAINIPGDAIACSSIPPYNVHLGDNIYEWIHKHFTDYDLHAIFILSHNFYDSITSLNEMGAAWVMARKSTLILLPGFDFDDIKGCIQSSDIGIKLDNDDCKFRLNELKNELLFEFDLKHVNDNMWERVRDRFIDIVNS